MNIRVDTRGLESRLERVRAARAWSPGAVEALEAALRSGGDDELFRADPLRFAAARSVDEQESIDLFLHAASAGLFELRWHLVCAFCGHVVESLGELSSLHAHYRCNFCSAMNEGDLDDAIQAAFTVSPQVRAIAFHRPEELSIEDYYLRYHFAHGVTFASGASVPQVGKAITRFMAWVEPGERVAFETQVEPGRLGLKDLRHRVSIAFFLEEARREREELHVRLTDGALQVESRAPSPRTLVQRNATFEYDATLDIESGNVRVEFVNTTPNRCPLWALHLPATFESSRVGLGRYLSAKRLLSTQTFRELFRTATLRADEGVGVRDLTFLFTDLRGSTELYDQVGDLTAFFLVRQHFEELTSTVAHHGGAVVKTIGDAVMATFPSPDAAVRAAVGMMGAIRRLNERVATPLRLKVGVHRGPAVAVTMNDRLDFFGQTVNIAARIQGIAGADEICLGASTFDDPSVRASLEGLRVARDEVKLKGVASKVEIYRLTP